MFDFKKHTLKVNCDTVVVQFNPTKEFIDLLESRYFRYRTQVFQGQEDLKGFQLFQIDINQFRSIGKHQSQIISSTDIFGKTKILVDAINEDTGELKSVSTLMDCSRQKHLYTIPASWNYDVNIEYRSDIDCRLMLSIPKYLYGHNILEFPDCEPQYFMEKLDNFFVYFFKKHFNANFYDLEPTYIRIDFGKNYHFSDYDKKVEWFQNAIREYQFIATKVYQDDSGQMTGTIEFKHDEYYIKIYDKGLEFEKDDLKRLRERYNYYNLPHRDRVNIDKNFEYLRNFAKNCVRIEYEVRSRRMTDLYLKTIENQQVSTNEKKHIKEVIREYSNIHQTIVDFKEVYKFPYQDDKILKTCEKFVKKHFDFCFNPLSLSLLRKCSLISDFSRLSYNQYDVKYTCVGGVRFPEIIKGEFVDKDFQKDFSYLFFQLHEKFETNTESFLVSLFWGNDGVGLLKEYQKIKRVRPAVPTFCKGYSRQVRLFNGRVKYANTIVLNTPIFEEVYKKMNDILSRCDMNCQPSNISNYLIKNQRLIIDTMRIKSIDKYLRHIYKKGHDPSYSKIKKNRTTYYRLENELKTIVEELKPIIDNKKLESFILWQKVNHNQLKVS